MKRTSAWVVAIAAGLAAGACGEARNKPIPLESPPADIQAAGAPETVARISDAIGDNDWIKDVAIVDSDLYVAVAWSGVYRLPKHGGAVTAVDQGTGRTEFSELANGDGAVFWEASSADDRDFPTSHLRRLNAGDTAASTIYQAALGFVGDGRGRNLQVDGSIVYLTQIQNITDLGAIHRIPTTGGVELSTLMAFTLPDGGYHSPTDPPRTWIVRDGGVFYADCPLNGGSCEIQRMDADGTRTIATFPGQEAYVRVVDETSIYVTNPIVVAGPTPSVTTPLLRVDRQTGELVELTPDCGCGLLMLDGGQELFYVTANVPRSNTLEAISKDGGPPRDLATLTSQQTLFRMAQDDTYLFVVTGDLDSQVLAVRKGTPAQP
jgi:hypothetical protein